MLETRVLLRVGGALAVCAALAWLGGTILGEFPFQGEGRYIAIFGGFALGAALAWISNRLVAGPPPVWLIVVIAAIAVAGEAHAVNIDTPPGASWPGEGWLAVVGAGAAAAYGIWTARKDRLQSA